uniref:Uncharacterized protein n=1 Tax=Aegilops tauschii TaxID=37682 RepID=M8AQZ6_AEGTA
MAEQGGGVGPVPGEEADAADQRRAAGWRGGAAVEVLMLPVPQRKSPWQRDELKLFAGVAQGVSGVAGNPTLGLAQGVSGVAGIPTAGPVQGVADHPTLPKPQGVSAKSTVVESKAVSGQASVVEANCTNIDVCPELFASKSSGDDGKSTSKGPKKKISPKRSSPDTSTHDDSEVYQAGAKRRYHVAI